MRGKVRIGSLIVMTAFAGGCLDPYVPKHLPEAVSYLVVDGFLNVTDSTCTITLSKTLPIDTTTVIPVVTGASLVVLSGKGLFYPLTETAPGTYTASKMALDIHDTYDLSITTADKKLYYSDYVPVTLTPPIDSVSWKFKDTGIEVYVNTHNDTVKTGYYRWKFSETWAYQSKFHSHLMVNDTGAVVPRTDKDPNIIDCYSSTRTSDIRLSTTSRLNQNVISEYRLTSIDLTDDRLESKYSIEVEQHALSADFYNYAQLLKNTTEGLGGLFDPLPTTVTGNFHSYPDKSEIVLGYFSAGTVTRKRIFITRKQVDPSGSILVNTGYENCKVDTILLTKLYELKYWSPYEYLYLGDSEIIIGYYASTPECVDCRLKGGTNIKPSFWQ